MTKDKALRMALEALEMYELETNSEFQRKAIIAIKKALAHVDGNDTSQKRVDKAEEKRHEPVAWMFEFPDKRVKPKFDSAPHGGDWQPLYIHPQPDAYGYAKRLSEAIWKKHYQSTAPQWKPFDDLMGVLTQIDNMTAGLTTPPAAQRPWVGLDWLPEHKCGLHLIHNEHRDVYETVEQFYDVDDFISEEEWHKAVAEDSVWVLHWYPNTPVGFTRIAASTLDDIEAKLRSKNT